MFNVQTVENDDIGTPDDLYEDLNEEYHFDHDPCPMNGASNEKVPNGLASKTRWGHCNFVNPPYSDIPAWMKKAVREMDEYGSKSVFLVPARTNSVYWRDIVLPNATDIRFISGRIKFKGYNVGFPHPIALVEFDPNKQPVARVHKTAHGYTFWNVA
jgi:hypothetical protein